ncbi:MAG: MBL fold metallo-hydrolase, partial [Planctomycetota bacterium]
EYTIFEDYEEIEGIQIAHVQKIYVNQLLEDEESEKFRLAQKLEIDEFTLSPEIEEGWFDPPDDPFDVGGLNPDSAKTRAEKLLAFFKGRRNPNKAGWACTAIARLQAREAIGTLVESKNKEIAHYGHLALIRSGSSAEIPEDYRASTYKRKVDVSLGYSKGTGQLSVRFVGCGGVRLDAQDTTLFVDAIYQPRLFNTACPALDTKAIVKADALFFTHAHRDHFDPWAAADVLKRTGAVAVGPPTVIALLKKEGIADDRLISLAPEKKKPAREKVGKVEIEAHAVGHAGKFTKKGKPEHLAFILRIGAIMVVHFGAAGEIKDMDEEAAKGAEIFFLPTGMLVEKNREFFKSTGVRYFVPTRFRDGQGSYGSVIGLRDRFQKVVPMLPGQELTFH